MSLVRCEVIPEILEVGALAALNQGFGGRPVEAEMPYVGAVVNGLPSSHARDESIHQDEFRHFRRELRGVGVGDHKADVVSHHLGLLHAEGLSEAMNADGGALHVQTVGRNVRVSDAGQVWCDYGEALRQDGNDLLPHPRGLRIAVQQYERCTLASGHVMQFDAINLRSARDDRFFCSLSVNLRGERDGEKKWTKGGQDRKKLQGGFHKRFPTRGT